MFVGGVERTDHRIDLALTRRPVKLRLAIIGTVADHCAKPPALIDAIVSVFKLKSKGVQESANSRLHHF
ncbi:hypothetical protein [Mycolicibacterium sp. XJ879]